MDLFTPRTMPIFMMFFFWGFGTGGLWLARPLVAYDLSESFLLVAARLRRQRSAAVVPPVRSPAT